MSNIHLRNITNHFQDVRLLSLASWGRAVEISPRDRNGPYIILQEGYDPNDLTMTPDEFILGRSGRWLSLALFYQLPVPERRAEFVFGTLTEVMQMMQGLPPKVAMFSRATGPDTGAPSESDEMPAAIEAARQRDEGRSRTAR